MDTAMLPLCGEAARPGASTPQRAESLLETVRHGTDAKARVAAAHQLASMLEEAEEAFKAAVGDAAARPAQRLHHPIGKLLTAVGHGEALGTALQALLTPRMPAEGPEGDAALAGCVAGLRLLAAAANAGPDVLAFPLRGTTLEDAVKAWVLVDDHKPPAVEGDPAPATVRAFLLEAQATYATGVLAALVEDPQTSQVFVRSDVPAGLMRFLRRCASKGSGPAAIPASSASASASADIDGSVEALPAAAERLRALRRANAVAALTFLGDYLECLSPLLHERTVESCLALLRRGDLDSVRRAEVLCCMGALLAHRRVAETLADADPSLACVLATPINLHTADGLSQIMFALSAAPLTFERLTAGCAAQLAVAVLKIMDTGSNSARKNVSLFLSNALHFPALLTAFDAQGGLRKLLGLLHTTLHALRRAEGGEVRAERQLGYHIADTLSHYFRTHLVLHLTGLQRRLAPAPGSKQSTAAHRPLDVQQPAFDRMVHALGADRRLAEAFAAARWPVLDDFMASDGCALMLDLVQASPGERFFTEMAMYALDVLGIVTLVPGTRRNILAARMRRSRLGVSILLGAAAGSNFLGNPEVMAAALAVLGNCLQPPPALEAALPAAAPPSRPASPAAWLRTPARQPPTERHGADVLPAQLESTFALARRAMRAANGIKVLLTLLGGRPNSGGGTSGFPFRVRALACRCLKGLARDPAIRDILATLQVGKTLADSLHQSAGSGSLHRTAVSAADAGATPPPPHATWHSYYNELALQLIALTTAAGDKVLSTTLAVLPGGAGAPATALQALERAAAAAATPLAYQPGELLQLIAEHLRASGLAASADTLTGEAGLTPSPAGSTGASCGFAGKTAAAAPQRSAAKHAAQGAAQSAETLSPEGADSMAADSIAPPPAKRRRLSVAPKLQMALAGCSAGRASSLPPPSSRGPELQRTSELPQQRRASASASAAPAVADRAMSGDDASWLSRLSSPAAMPAVSAAAAASAPAPTSVGSLLKGLPRRARLQHDRTGSSLRPFSTVSRPPSSSSPLADTPATATAAAAAAAAAAVPASADCSPAEGSPAESRLHSMVMAHLRAQHEAACAAAANPISTLAPISLLEPHVLPEASRRELAPVNATARLLRRQMVGPHGGAGGRRLQRHLIHSRYRVVRSLRNEHLSVFKCAAFVDQGELLAVGMHSGEVRLYDLASGELAGCGTDPHAAPVNLLQARPGPSGGITALLSSSRQDVKLWDAPDLNKPPAVTLSGYRGGHFSRNGTQIAAVASYSRKAAIFDVATGSLVTRLDDSTETIGGGGERAQRCCRDYAIFSPADDWTLMWGDQLWDVRTPRAVHRFDSFTSFATGYFHPAGLEVLINSEVWDVRTRRLCRAAQALDGAAPVFSHVSSDVIYASQRRLTDDLDVELTGRRTRHPLHTAFRAVDARDYSEIATLDADGRAVLSIAVDAGDSCLAAVIAEGGDAASSAVRIYDIGRHPALDDDSDGEDAVVDEEEDSDGEDDDEDSEVDDSSDTSDDDGGESAGEESGADGGVGAGPILIGTGTFVDAPANGDSEGMGGSGSDDSMSDEDDSDGMSDEDGSVYLMDGEADSDEDWHTDSGSEGGSGRQEAPPAWARRRGH